MSKLAGALRWLSRYGHRIPAVAVEALGATRKGGVDGLSSWWRAKTSEWETWRGQVETQLGYEEWLAERMAQRPRLERVAERIFFSILTSAFDTPAELLEEAAASVFGQSFRDFEWVLVDNGSTREETRRALAAIARRDGRVRLVREEKNRGPLGGMRRALEEARGSYAVPFDSDDLLLADALAVLAHEVVNGGRPAFLYSDEEILDGPNRTPFLRTEWDPVQVVSNSYIFHLCAIERARALEVGVYADVGANWCHDWDTALRVLRAGLPARHVPEVLYRWRVHAGSSTNRVAPDRTNSLASQKHVLEEHLAARGLADRFAVEPSPIDRGAPEYWLRRLPVEPAPIVESVTPRTVEELRAGAARAAEKGAWIAIVGPDVEPESPDWLWQALGLRELFPDAALIGGRLVDPTGRVLEGAGHFGFDGLAGSPESGHDRRDPGYFSVLLKQRSASAVPWAFSFCDPALLAAVDGGASFATLSARLGAAAARAGKRVVYSPFLAAVSRREPERASAEEVRRFLAENRDLFPDERFYPAHFGLERARAFELARPEARRRSVDALVGAGASA